MLDKIINITPGSDFKNSNHSRKEKKEFFLARSASSVDVHDSFSISPAFLFLSHLNWHIVNLKLLKDEKLDVTFTIGDITIQTEIDPERLTKNYIFTYNLSQKRAFTSFERISFITLDKKFANNIKTIDDYKSTLKLFDRVWNLNFNNELNDEECYLNTLLEEIYDGVNAEMEFITVSLLKFLEKLLNKNMMHFFIPDERKILALKIKKIKSVNA